MEKCQIAKEAKRGSQGEEETETDAGGRRGQAVKEASGVRDLQPLKLEEESLRRMEMEIRLL